MLVGAGIDGIAARSIRRAIMATMAPVHEKVHQRAGEKYQSPWQNAQRMQPVLGNQEVNGDRRETDKYQRREPLSIACPSMRIMVHVGLPAVSDGRRTSPSLTRTWERLNPYSEPKIFSCPMRVGLSGLSGSMAPSSIDRT